MKKSETSNVTSHHGKSRSGKSNSRHGKSRSGKSNGDEQQQDNSAVSGSHHLDGSFMARSQVNPSFIAQHHTSGQDRTGVGFHQPPVLTDINGSHVRISSGGSAQALSKGGSRFKGKGPQRHSVLGKKPSPLELQTKIDKTSSILALQHHRQSQGVSGDTKSKNSVGVSAADQSEVSELVNQRRAKMANAKSALRRKAVDEKNLLIYRSKTVQNMVGQANAHQRNLMDDLEEDQEEYVPTMKEKFLQSQLKVPMCMFRYNNKFRMRWDLYVMLLAIWNCLIIPFDVAFEPEKNLLYNVLDRFIDASFIADIVINFRTTFINKKTGIEVIQQGQVAKNYLSTGWFFIDLAASIPFEYVYSFFKGDDENSLDSEQLKLLGLLKLVRLLRLGRIIRYMNFKQGLKIGLMMVQLLSFLVMLVHWIGCVWYLMVRQEGDWVPPKDLDYEARDPDRLWTKTEFYDQDTYSKYATVTYYAILTMMGNELAPRNTLQTVVSAIIIITGAVFSAFIFGNMAALMATMNKKATHFDEQLDLVNNTMRSMKLPEEMQDQVVKFMLHVQHSPDLHQDLYKFFSILNEPLKKQILYHLTAPLIQKVSLLKQCSSVEQSFFICNLKPVLFLPEDIIIREGERGDNLYLLNKGEVKILLQQPQAKGGRYPFMQTGSNHNLQTENDKGANSSPVKGKATKSSQVMSSQSPEKGSSQQPTPSAPQTPSGRKELNNNEEIALLSDGSIFGEIALLTKLKRTASAKSTKFTNCAFLNRQDIKVVQEQFPHLVIQMKTKMIDYNDVLMEFRRSMIRNLHFLRDLPNEIVNQLICCMEVKRFARGSTIIKSGDVSESLYVLRKGQIEIYVSKDIAGEKLPEKAPKMQMENDLDVCFVDESEELLFDTLNTGSAFCCYTFISDEAQQLQKFKAKNTCIIESIHRDDIFKLAKKYFQLADKLDFIKGKFEEQEIDFDFFRYYPQRKKPLPPEIKKMIRQKFWAALTKFFRKYKKGEADLPKPLRIIKEFQAKRAMKQEQFNMMRSVMLTQQGKTGGQLDQQAPQFAGGNLVNGAAAGNGGAVQRDGDKSGGGSVVGPGAPSFCESPPGSKCQTPFKKQHQDNTLTGKLSMAQAQVSKSLAGVRPQFSKKRQEQVGFLLNEELLKQNMELNDSIRGAQIALQGQKFLIMQLIKDFKGKSDEVKDQFSQLTKELDQETKISNQIE